MYIAEKKHPDESHPNQSHEKTTILEGSVCMHSLDMIRTNTLISYVVFNNVLKM